MKIIQREKAYETELLAPTFRRRQSLIWERGEDGALLTNVALQAIHHSPTGFDIGYPGSGPADLALNAMAALFPISDEADEANITECFKGAVSNDAWRLHQPFKFRFLANANQQQGEISWEEIQTWLKEQNLKA